MLVHGNNWFWVDGIGCIGWMQETGRNVELCDMSWNWERKRSVAGQSDFY